MNRDLSQRPVDEHGDAAFSAKHRLPECRLMFSQFFLLSEEQ